MVKKRDAPKSEKGWVTAKVICQVFDCSLTNFENNLRPLLRAEHMRVVGPGRGKQNLYFARALLDAWKGKDRQNGHDPLVEGNGKADPTLQRYRLAMAKKVERENAVEEGNLLRMEDVRMLHLKLVGLLRAAGQAYQRQYGPDGLRIMEDTLHDFKRLVNTFGDDDTTTEPPGPAPPV